MLTCYDDPKPRIVVHHIIFILPQISWLDIQSEHEGCPKTRLEVDTIVGDILEVQPLGDVDDDREDDDGEDVDQGPAGAAL